MQLTSEPQAEAFMHFKGEIVTREMLGSETIYQVKNDQYTFMIKNFDDAFRVNDHVCVNVALDHIHIFDPQEQRVKRGSEEFDRAINSLRGQ